MRRIIEKREVPLPKSWENFLSLPENKADLSNFLSKELCAQAPNNKEVVVAGGFKEGTEARSNNS